MQRCLVAFELLALHSNKAAQQQFLKQINWNFMESSISEIDIWLNLQVSASNELGKVWEEGSLVAIVKIVKRMPGRDEWKENMKKMCFTVRRRVRSSICSSLPLFHLSNDGFLLNLLTGRDYLYTGWLKSLIVFLLISTLFPKYLAKISLHQKITQLRWSPWFNNFLKISG